MKKMRVLFIASLVAGAFAANHTCTTTSTAKWVVGSAGKSTASNATTGKCWERDWCNASTTVAASCSDGTSTTSSACTALGVCFQKDKDGVSTADGATRCPAIAPITTSDTGATACAAASYTPTGASTATTGGVFVAYVWTAAVTQSTRTTVRGSNTDTITGTGTDAEWDTIRAAGATGHCGCYDSLNTAVQAAGSLAPVTDCTTNSHSHRRYCSSDGGTVGFTSAMTYVQANKAVSPATSPVTYMSKTGASSGLASDGPHFQSMSHTCTGTVKTAGAANAWTQTTASALDWKENYAVSSTGACTMNTTSTSPAAALSGIVAMFFALMAML